MLQNRLKLIQEFQIKYPTAHVGGSIGLLLHGINLKRSLNLSDIDMVVDVPIDKTDLLNDYTESSNPSDFDYSLRKFIDGSNGQYIKLEIRISPEPSFVSIYHDGFAYNVSKLRDIIFWKQKYATNGSQKHIDDIAVINGGERPVFIQPEYVIDDLPF